MAVQVSWPGVYIDEFEPGAPIQGVGTNTPVFIGIAERGPRNIATQIFSWDEFSSTFGGFLADPNAWLAQGVWGFLCQVVLPDLEERPVPLNGYRLATMSGEQVHTRQAQIGTAARQLDQDTGPRADIEDL
jgi:hypothetical protein